MTVKGIALGICLTLPALSGCLAFDETWDNAAYQECNGTPNIEDRQKCRARVEDLIHERDVRNARLEDSVRSSPDAPAKRAK